MGDALQACPHCGATLPYVRDAFCPECDKPLDEPPHAAAAAFRGPIQSDKAFCRREVTCRSIPFVQALLSALDRKCSAVWARLMALSCQRRPRAG